MKHYEVVCAIIKNKEGKILCCKRGPGRALEGFWEFPGGKVEAAESHEQTIIREIKEELCVDITPLKYIGESKHEYTNLAPYPNFSITLYGYICKLEDTHIITTEHTDIKWLTPNEMKNYRFAEADKPFVQHLTTII